MWEGSFYRSDLLEGSHKVSRDHQRTEEGERRSMGRSQGRRYTERAFAEAPHRRARSSYSRSPLRRRLQSGAGLRQCGPPGQSQEDETGGRSWLDEEPPGFWEGRGGSVRCDSKRGGGGKKSFPEKGRHSQREEVEERSKKGQKEGRETRTEEEPNPSCPPSGRARFGSGVGQQRTRSFASEEEEITEEGEEDDQEGKKETSKLLAQWELQGKFKQLPGNQCGSGGHFRTIQDGKKDLEEMSGGLDGYFVGHNAGAVAHCTRPAVGSRQERAPTTISAVFPRKYRPSDASCHEEGRVASGLLPGPGHTGPHTRAHGRDVTTSEGVGWADEREALDGHVPIRTGSRGDRNRRYAPRDGSCSKRSSRGWKAESTVQPRLRGDSQSRPDARVEERVNREGQGRQGPGKREGLAPSKSGPTRHQARSTSRERKRANKGKVRSHEAVDKSGLPLADLGGEEPPGTMKRSGSVDAFSPAAGEGAAASVSGIFS